MLLEDGLARLTPGFFSAAQGRVHSVFRQVVNLWMEEGGTGRMLALTLRDLPALPDSVCLSPQALRSLAVGQPVALADARLTWAGWAVRLIPDDGFTGRLLSLDGVPCADGFAACTAFLRCGLHQLPATLRRRAEQALLDGRWQAYLGLGCGLTPSFDDACVGMAAVYHAMGRPLPPLPDLSVTTDVSARYLRLAQEGYFGQPVLDVIHAL